MGISAGLVCGITTKLPLRDYYCKELGSDHYMNGPHSAGLLSYEKLLPMLGGGGGGGGGVTTIHRKTLRGIRQLVYKDNWSTTTVCRMRHLVYSLFYLRHLVEKMVK